MDVDLYADPSCAWSWAAYTWLDEVAPRRQLRLRFQPFSLALRDGTAGMAEPQRRVREHARRVLRVAVAIDDADARTCFYATVTRCAFASPARIPAAGFDIAAGLAAAGLPPQLSVAADDAARDDDVRAVMAGVATLLPPSDDTVQRIPVLVLDGRAGCYGPLLDPVPRGRGALQLWDALEALLRLDGVYEISRPRPRRHSLLAVIA